MKLKQMLVGLEGLKAKGNLEIEIAGIERDSRTIKEGDLYVAIKGFEVDGHSFIENAIENGAIAIAVEEGCDFKGLNIPEDITIVMAKNTRELLAICSSNFYGNPSRKFKLIGVTGTKGKTTTTFMIKEILEKAGKKVGLIGTIATYMNGKKIKNSDRTTPESVELQRDFATMVENGVEVVVMEVSSQGLMLHRTQGFIFDIGIFTNIEPDHIGPNEHKDFDDYMHCKGLLFNQCKVGICNGDDIHTDDILEGHTCEVETYGFGEGNDIRAINLAYIHKPGQLGVFFDTDGLIKVHAEVETQGKFSVLNALCAIAVSRHFGCSEAEIAPALKGAKVKGRIEMVKVSDDFTLMIDYAHNAMALKSLLTTLRDYHPNRLICLFGCGGNRSKLRRFEMGEVSGKYADFTIITSDNPRFEEPEDIMNDIETGMKKTDGKYIKITDRKEAIAYAIDHGEQGDIIVLAGKGHEDYQEIKGVKYHMDERELIQEILEERK